MHQDDSSKITAGYVDDFKLQVISLTEKMVRCYVNLAKNLATTLKEINISLSALLTMTSSTFKVRFLIS